MGGFRPERIAVRIHEELSKMMIRDVKDPRVTPISITRVEIAKDLKRAVIQYLPLGGGEVSAELREGLRDVAGKLRGPVGRALGIRHSPELVFEVDTHTEQAIRVSSLIDSFRSREVVAVGEE